ncbi:MAG: hypothetical protein DWC07_00390 [Candidatus Poseidoniales archaeon]|nr:MAG: hypothetical protein DWC07_00390 [Candidatus Poseidoniales archaeon]
MDAQTVFQPKIWYIVCGAFAALGAVENMINAETWAESAWGADGVNDQSIAHEMFFGVVFLAFSAMAFVSAFLLDGSTQAKFAMANAGVMVAFFVAMFIVLPAQGYELPGVTWLIPPLVLMGGLGTSGFLHKDGEAPAAEA